MRGIVIGSTGTLRWSEVPDPPPAAPDEVVIRVAATAVNRADLLQRAGRYAPPPGASPILGLECAGTVMAAGSDVTRWAVGDRVCALLAGGGYAEQVVVPHGHLLPVPAGMAMTDAAALPEAVCTAWSNLAQVGALREGELALVHGGAGGIGTMALQVARFLGARVLTTARAEWADACRALGADDVVDYRTEDFVERARRLGGADVILDVQGAAYLARNLQALAPDGRIVVIGLLGGSLTEIDLGALMAKRGSVASTTLRTRSADFKTSLIDDIRARIWDTVIADEVRPVVARVVPIEDAEQALALVAAGGQLGKVVLSVP